jgi:hypothetical protein
MKKLYALLLFLQYPIILLSQDNSSGAYYYTVNDYTYKLDLFTDSSFVRTVTHLAGITKHMGKWHQYSDTVQLVISSVYANSETKKIETQIENYRLMGYALLRQIVAGSDFHIDYRKHTEYFPNGRLKMEIKGFVQYPLTGIITTYYLNGKIRELTYYKKGKKNGNYFKFNEQGILIVEGKYKSDKETGDWKFYDDKGLPKIPDSVATNGKNK